MDKKIVKVCDQNITFRRRKYGHTCYTWAYIVKENGEMVSMGDPWQGITWPKAELERAICITLKAKSVIQAI